MGRRIRLVWGVIPFDNAKEAAVAEGLNVIPVKSLAEAVDYLLGVKKILPFKVDINTMFNKQNAIQLISPMLKVRNTSNVRSKLQNQADTTFRQPDNPKDNKKGHLLLESNEFSCLR